MTQKKPTNRELASEAEVSYGLVGRKRREGKSDADIVAEAALRKQLLEAQAPQADSTGSAPVESYAAAQSRKQSALADLHELDYRVKLGELVDVGEMERAWATAGQSIRDGFLSMPSRISEHLAALTDCRQIHSVLTGEIRKILSDLPEQIHNAAKAIQ